MSSALTGSQFGPYEVIEEIGRGGMGVVYWALETPLQRVVALKVLAPRYLDDTVARSRFQLEIKAAVAIEHPNVVPVYNAGFEDGRFFLAMRRAWMRSLAVGPERRTLAGASGDATRRPDCERPRDRA